VGGTHPALVEAMGFGNCVVAYNTAENRETIADAGLVYDGEVGSESLRQELRHLLADPGKVEEYRQRARQRAQSYYSWEAVTDAYERLCYQVCGWPLPERLEQ
jgi:glycosyltransferase involved in cell wall biosynthesis